MSAFGTRFRKRFRIVAGCILVVVGFFGVPYSIKAALAQSSYLRVKYGFFRGTSCEVPKVEDLTTATIKYTKAKERYDYNYYYPVYIGNLSLKAALQATSMDEYRPYLNAALFYSAEAMALNPYNSEARFLRSAALCQAGDKESLQRALDMWRPIVDREYWVPENHDELARVLLRINSATSLVLAAREARLVGDPALRTRLTNLSKLLKLEK